MKQQLLLGESKCKVWLHFYKAKSLFRNERLDNRDGPGKKNSGGSKAKSQRVAF